MCGRYVIKNLEKILKDHPKGRTVRDYIDDVMNDRFNVAPFQTVPLIREVDGELVVEDLTWSYRGREGKPITCSRLETMLEKPGYFAKFERVLTPMSGFYEWPFIDGEKQPHFIQPKPPEEGWWIASVLGDYEEGRRMTLMTRETSAHFLKIHKRWVGILSAEEAGHWVDAKVKPKDALQLIQPWPDERIEAYRVGPACGNWRNQGPELIEPLDKQGSLGL